MCSLICNGEDFEDIVLFGEENIDWLKQILELPAGIPSHDTFNRVLQMLDPESLGETLEKDEKKLLDTLNEKQICIDGKKIKGVAPKSKGNGGLYILSVWGSENRLCVGQKKVEKKSNEITAIPKLLNDIDINGAVVNIDAIGCQKNIAELILEKKGNIFIISLMSIEILLVQILNKIPRIGKCTRKFWQQIFVVMLTYRGKHNFTNLSRYSNLSETTIRKWFSKEFNFIDEKNRSSYLSIWEAVWYCYERKIRSTDFTTRFICTDMFVFNSKQNEYRFRILTS